jgi:hypothetical protein
VPSGVTVGATTASSVALSWTASTDDAVTAYRVLHDGNPSAHGARPPRRATGAPG